jgi:hypothetical protein
VVCLVHNRTGIYPWSLVSAPFFCPSLDIYFAFLMVACLFFQVYINRVLFRSILACFVLLVIIERLYAKFFVLYRQQRFIARDMYPK